MVGPTEGKTQNTWTASLGVLQQVKAAPETHGSQREMEMLRSNAYNLCFKSTGYHSMPWRKSFKIRDSIKNKTIKKDKESP